MTARGPWLIQWDAGGMVYGWVVVWAAIDVSPEEIERTIDMFLGEDGPGGDGYVVEQWALAIHRHKWCEPNGFASIDGLDGEWHRHFEEIRNSKPTATVARLTREETGHA